MDMKINGNNYLQNEFMTKVKDVNISEAAHKRRAVLERSAGAFKQAAANLYDKTGKFGADKKTELKENEQLIADEFETADMISCIDTIKNLVTPEDYSELEAWGLIPDEDNPEAFVTVYERIQIELAAYCDDYDAASLNISDAKMKEVLGSEAMASAKRLAEDISKSGDILNDDVKEYIIENELEPTISNVYKAVYSGAVPADNAHISDSDWEQLKGQVERFFDTNGMENNSENLQRAKWIVSKNLPLNVENFEKLSALEEVDFSNESYNKKLEDSIAYTICFGGDGLNADITGKKYDTDTIKEAVDTVKSAMDSDVDYILKNNRKLNIENLKHRVEERKKAEINKRYDSVKDDGENHTVTNKILIEARAILTSGSLFAMQKTGISITYTEITILTSVSKEMNNVFAENLFMLDGEKPAESDRNLLAETLNVMKGFGKLPVNVAGKIYTREIEFTAGAVYNEGKLMMAKYSFAAKSYETLGTTVRADLGDNIKKAFRNIDEILSSEDIEVNDENRRAARVLGYNGSEITKESVKDVSEILGQLDDLIRNFTPRAAVYLIKEGINPLNTNIKELNEKLKSINDNLNAGDDDGKYSEYLWKLEKKKGITKEERNAYVQLYRIIEHIKKQDGRVAGLVADAGKEMTLSNLYSAVKSLKAGSIDRTVDDETGLLDGGYSDDDLVTYMKNAAAIMDDDTLHNEYKYQRISKKLDRMVETMSEQEFTRIMSGMEHVSINNIYIAMVASNPHFYKAFKKLDDHNLQRQSDNITNVWTDEGDITEEQVVSSYMNLKVAAESQNNEKEYDMAVLRSDMRQAVSFMEKQALRRSYYIPMEISGDMTVVHMTFKQGNKAEKGRISIYTELEEGKISVLLKKQSDGYRIYAATDSLSLKAKLDMYVEERVTITDRVTDGMWDKTLDNSAADNINQIMFSESDEVYSDKSQELTYGELARAAKEFIHKVLKNI